LGGQSQTEKTRSIDQSSNLEKERGVELITAPKVQKEYSHGYRGAPT